MRWLLIFSTLIAYGCGSYRDGLQPPLRVMHKNPDWMVPFSPGFHGFAVRDAYWDLNACRVCHGKDLTGDSKGESCKVCHETAEVARREMPHQAPGSCVTCHKKGVTACNTCHGNKDNFAPPRAVNGAIEVSYTGVGAHQIHIKDSPFSKGLSCNACHPETPKGHPAADHGDLSGHATVAFGVAATGNGRLKPQWNRDKGSCSNVMCHGWPGSEGKRKEFRWTRPSGKPVKCGDCHGLPPKGLPGGTGHPEADINTCHVCHGAVVDEKGKIRNPELHINGVFDGNG